MDHPQISTNRLMIIQYAGADGRLVHQSILGGRLPGGRFCHYPLAGGVGTIRLGDFRVARLATSGDIELALANSRIVYAEAEAEGMKALERQKVIETDNTL